MTREKPAAPIRAPRRSGLRADPPSALIRRPRPPGEARDLAAHGGPRLPDSWQRIDGVSRLLPYSDLLTLTSSSRRGEGLSDRGSWKRLRILLTGHVDAHVEPDIETAAVLSRACVVA